MRRTPLVLAVLAVAACDGRGRLINPTYARGRVLNEHNLTVGQRLDAGPMHCDPAGEAIFPGHARLKVVTFTTPDDCTQCLQHLLGLESLASEDTLVGSGYYLVSVPARDVEAALRGYRAWTQRRVCFDTSGVIWRSSGIANTPVTVLLESGVVRYMVDAPLESQRARALLRQDVAAVVQQIGAGR